jgi:hypothetical protein
MLRKTIVLAWTLLGLSFGLGANAEAGSALALDVIGGKEFFDEFTQNLTIGWSFTVTTPVTVMDLGIWDFADHTLVHDHPVGIWDAGGTLLASTTITSSSTTVASSSGEGQWLFNSIHPLVLTDGHYVVGALIYFNDLVDGGQTKAKYTTAPGVTYDANAELYANTLSFPNGTFAGFDGGNFGANFEFASVPEPSTLTLLGVAGMCLAVAAGRGITPSRPLTGTGPIIRISGA